jgi:two-component system response regulator FixJ
MAAKRTVHVIDDEAPVRRSIAFLLRASGYDVAVHVSGDDFLKVARHVAPGCLLLDIRMPGRDGLEVQRELGAMGVSMPVVVMTGHGDIVTAVQAMKDGAVDFVEKPVDQATLLSVLSIAFDRKEDAVSHAEEVRQARIRLAVLTQREQDVLTCLAQGKANKVIARDLEISPRTVEVHRANLMAKLDVQSLSEALRLAFLARLDAAAEGPYSS